MRYSNVYYIVTTVVVAPLWVGQVNNFFKDKPILSIIAIIISSLILLFVAALAAYDFIIKHDLCYKFQCWKMDSAANRARKKLKKIISKTNNPSVRNYAFNKLREITPQKICYGILNDLAERERNPVVKNILLSQMEIIGEEK
jgi:hypothetical protein